MSDGLLWLLRKCNSWYYLILLQYQNWMEPFLPEPSSPHCSRSCTRTCNAPYYELSQSLLPDYAKLAVSSVKWKVAFHRGFIWVDKLRAPVDRMRVVAPHVANTGWTSCFRNSFFSLCFTHRPSTSRLMSCHLFFSSIPCPHPLHRATLFPVFIQLNRIEYVLLSCDGEIAVFQQHTSKNKHYMK